MTLGARIKQLRKEKGITQQDLAKGIDKSKGSIASYESDRRKPSLEVIKQIADYFDVSIDYLTCRSNIKQDPYFKIKEAIEDEPELLDFWELMRNRENLQLMFKQTKNLSDEDIKFVVNLIRKIEKEEGNI